MSNINPSSIDIAYPVAGQDNDSQGFRDNFTNISNNFERARAEISELQSKAVLKTKLDSQTALDNDFANSFIESARIRDIRETRLALVMDTDTLTVDHSLSHYQTVTTTRDFSIEFTNFPAAGSLGRVRLEVTVDNVGHVMTLPNTVTIGTTGISGLLPATGGTSEVTFSETGTYIFEFCTEDGGTTFSINDLTRARSYIPSDKLQLRPTTFDPDGEEGDQVGMISVDSDAVYICVTDFDGSSTGKWRTATTLVKNTVTNQVIDSSSLVSVTNLSFVSKPNTIYQFDAMIPFTHSASSVSTHTFSVEFANGVCNYIVEQQTSPTSAYTVSALSTSNSTSAAATTASTSMRFAKVSGIFSNTHSANVTVSIRAATSAGNLTILSGSTLRIDQIS